MINTVWAQPGVAVITIEGRGPLSLLGLETFGILKAELDRLDQDQRVKAVILNGSGDRAFSAGGDFNQMKNMDSADACTTTLFGKIQRDLIHETSSRSTRICES